MEQSQKPGTVKTICYGKEKVWNTREEAEEHFLSAMAGSEGSESERYAKILMELLNGKDVCSDE